MKRLNTPTFRLVLGLVLVIAGGTQSAGVDRGVTVREVVRQGQPMSFMVLSPEARRSRAPTAPGTASETQPEPPPPVRPERYPAVVLAHGFAGSRKIMQSYANVLVDAGYAVLSFDFSGHGSNPARFDFDRLNDDLERAYETLIAQPEVDDTRVALVGHSMGSGVVMDAALRSPQRYRATVAISPVHRPVTPATPRNLQLQAGTWEPRFARQARQLLEQAGGEADDFYNGRARQLVLVPAAEHVSILFRDASHGAVRTWLDRAMDVDATTRRPYTDRRILWWLLHVVGWLLVLSSMRPAVRGDPERDDVAALRRPMARWVLLLVAPLVASLVCGLLARWIDLDSLAGLPVGGAVALWMLLAGVIYLLAGFRIDKPIWRDVFVGAGMFAFLWLTVGLTAELVWLQWTLVGSRLVRWPLLAVACIPWFVATEAAQGDPRGPGRTVWWLAQSTAMVLGLLMLSTVTPGLAVLGLLVPLVPLVTACLVATGSRVNRPWAYGIGAGLFFGWLLAGSFPLLG